VDAVAAGRRELVEVTYRELLPGDRDGHLMRRKVTEKPRQLPGGRVELVMEWPNGKRDRATPLASRKVQVMRVVAGPGMALRDRRKARSTGGVVEVWDTEHVDSPVTPDQVRGHRWAMRCEHGTAVGRRTYDEAIDDVKDPRLWCVDCVPAKAGPGAMMLPLL
jgi:hypothetical protein